MIEIIVLIVLVSFYFCVESSDTSLKEASVAIGLYGIYLVVYLLIEPFPTATSKHMGELYGFLPALSFGSILFPHFNKSAPEVVTKTIGWAGLTTAFFILSYFKFFVW